jgi:hypothetical protein
LFKSKENFLQVGCGPLTLTLPIHDVDPREVQGILLPGMLGVVAPKCDNYDDSWSDKAIEVVIREG